ncbi:hypothetical protein DFH08DRAFT_975452 [Mycena albidolilacea]|uniref:DUF6534 domain-containing protein n=1 Tax=Mycena albidolilacea TaxID=1033008 RepID=A0AAD7EB41_9AGAR|nr:hypothetical protein DFH08DRAFT_975452 [Mycena albidolilacea]
MEPLNLNPNTGAYEIGVLLSYVLFGVTTTQAYLYYTRFPEDSRKLKALVVFVWSCELAHALCLGMTLYRWTITYSGRADVLKFFPAPLAISEIFSGFVATCVQSFFGYRIYVLSKKPYISYLTWTLAFLRCLAAIAIGIAALLKDTLFHGYEVKWSWLINALWAVSITNDVVITTTLVYLLYMQRSAGQKRTIALIDKLIVWTIETGMVTRSVLFMSWDVLFNAFTHSVSNIIILTLFLTMPDNLVWLAQWSIGARLFSNSLLARATIRTMNEIALFHSTPGSRTMNTPRPLDVEMTTTKVSQIV